jgi:O-antigen/teichoic acid export membrane protein
VLRAIVPYALLVGISPVLSHAVNYLGEGRRRVPIAIAALLVNLAIDLALLSEIGIVAGAIGTDVAYILYVGAHFWICRRLLGLRAGALVPTLVRTLAAAAAMAGILLAFGTSADLGVASLVAGAVLSLAVYAAVLVLVGAVSRTELAAAMARVRPARGR